MNLRLTAAGRAIVVYALALAFASMLNAEGIRKTAQTQPDGARRELALHATYPLVEVSRFLHLTTPRHELHAAIGREHEDDIDTAVRFAAPPAPIAPRDRVPVDQARRPGKTAPPANHQAPRKPAFDAARPLRVWIAGDSLVQVPGEAIQRAAGPESAVKVLGLESRLSTGLTRPDLYNWFVRFGEAISQLRPTAVVFSFGADDAHDYMAGVPAGRRIGPLGSSSWNAEYRRRVDGVTREFGAAGVATVWLGLPIPSGSGYARSFPVVNSILRSVAHAHPKTSRYIDTWHLLDSPRGKYTPYLRIGGKVTLLRSPDGIHFTDAAGDLIAREVMEAFRELYDLRAP
jgi:uncharacterized protein